MKGNNIEEYLDRLSTIQKVDAPPFLFTRIQQRIQDVIFPRVSPKTAWALCVSFVFLLIMNVYVIAHYHSDNSKENNLAQSFHLLPDNNLYR